MKNRSHFLLLGFFLFVFCSLSGQETDRVLFVGNSYTYFWNLPQQVEAMAVAEKVPLIARQSTSGGASLGRHWRNGRGLESNALIQSGAFNKVVLQDHSLRSIEHLDSLLSFGGDYVKRIRAAGAEPYLYMTWARDWDPTMQAEITSGYKKLAKQTGATIVPVGPAWEKCRSLRPEINLFDPDGSHPSPEGTYLSACVFYGILTGQSPVGLPNRLISRDANDQPLFLNVLSNNDALFLQRIAEQTIEAFDN